MRFSILKNHPLAGLSGFILSGLLLFTGCTTMGPKSMEEELVTEPAATELAVTEEAQKVKVESVNVVGDGDRVLIETSGTVRYTVFRLSEPGRLIVDLPGVDLESIPASFEVDNKFISEITAVNHGGDENIGRIVIGLKDGVDHEVKSGENSILVNLSHDPFAVIPKPSTAALQVAFRDGETGPSRTDAPPAVKKPALEPEAGNKEPANTVVAARREAEVHEVEVVRPAPLKAATRVEDIEYLHHEGDTVVHIITDGDIGDYESFELDDPSRVVIDLRGLENATGKDSLTINNELVNGVRVGSHPDKVRFVFDSATNTLPPYVITKAENYIVATFGKSVAGKKEEVSRDLSGAAEKIGGADGVEKAEAPAASAPEGQAQPDKAVDTMVAAKAEAAVAAEDMAKEPTPSAPAPKDPGAITLEEYRAMEAGKGSMAPQAENTAAAKEMVKAGSVVEDIDFKKVAGKGRLMIETSGRPVYDVKAAADGRTIVIDIKDASIGPELTRTLDATRLKTPVATISSYQSSADPHEVRVLVELSEKADYETKELNNTLSMVFTTATPAAEELVEEVEVSGVDAARKYTGQLIDLDMVDANITDVLRLLAEVSDLNIIASDDVQGTISLRLKGVPWDQAFDIILKSKGLDKIREGNVVRVAPATKISQEKESILAAKKAREKLEPLEIRFVPVNYAVAEELQDQVAGVLTDRGSVTSDGRTNTLIIKDIAQGIESAVDLVTRLDTPIPQVLIEARIVEASTSFARDLGIQWGVDYQTDGDISTDTFGSTTTSGQTPPSSTTSPVFEQRHGTGNYAVNLPASGTAGTLGALGFILGKAGQNPLVLDLRLSAGEQDGRLRTISRPRIVTMDNKEAKIEQGESIPFETTSAAGTETTFIDANLSLTVTPHITPDGSVLMKIKASRNSIGTFRTSSGEPSINKKESSTEVLVRDGETTVIGGIVISDNSETDSGIPFLMDIPVLGWIFKNNSISDSQTELLIFITPNIIKDNKVVS